MLVSGLLSPLCNHQKIAKKMHKNKLDIYKHVFKEPEYFTNFRWLATISPKI